MMMMTRWAANVSFPTRYMAAKRIGQSISSSHIIFLCIFPFTEGLKILGAINTRDANPGVGAQSSPGDPTTWLGKGMGNLIFNSPGDGGFF